MGKVIDQVDGFIEIIENIYKQTCKYIGDLDEKCGQQIVREFRDSSICLSLISEAIIKRAKNVCLDESIKKLISFKSAVTGDSFLGKNPAFSEDRKANIHNKYAVLLIELNEVKMKVYD